MSMTQKRSTGKWLGPGGWKCECCGPRRSIKRFAGRYVKRSEKNKVKIQIRQEI